MPYGKSNPKRGQESLGKALQRRRAQERAAADRYYTCWLQQQSNRAAQDGWLVSPTDSLVQWRPCSQLPVNT